MTVSAPTIGHAVSADGTRIGFEQFGSGPALVLVQGTMGTAYNFRELAEALADTYTVVVPDRRGRGLSPHAFSAAYTVDDDVRDLDAVLAATGARHVFGLSSGGDILLKAARSLPRIEKIALYEPAILPGGIPRKGAERFDAYSKADDLRGMLTTGMKLAEFGPALMRAMPDWVVKAAIGWIMKQEAKSGSDQYASMADLARAFRYDFVVVASMDGSIPTFKDITQPVLLLGGSKSPGYLGQALRALEKVLPGVRRVELAGLDHGAAWNIDRQRNKLGNPNAVAERLKEFF
ncbi:alpha/beta fold hydrolase [Actinospica robiniae]|uniref:Putative hydrolase or acyltransferase of alpha/beta superfamily n=1 Tax=Actinospica robiniae DSM 44927 TaxID=479430 RepID=W9DZ70_9ACTN|nr:alpha/beta hydrolase [Actinospica robiniae]ETA71103.1 putative hydrolase or acyltransferase of alpha/beta superfamily [Actinospica robiniae DSM 44927]